MVYGIIIYILIMVFISIYDFARVENFEDYAVAGKKQGFFAVFLSLMATMIGASATIGLTDKVINVGFPAFWWLGVGAIGLVLQSIFLSEKIRKLNANTLPDIAMITVGKGAKVLLAVLIVLAWVGIIAAQLVSLAKIISAILPDKSKELVIILIGIFIIIYTLIGGQLSVIKTDSIQSLMIAIGIIFTVIYLAVANKGSFNAVMDEIEFVNSDMTFFDIINLLFIVGGTYFLGPDIISRNLVSKDEKVAKKAAFISGLGLVFFAVIITFIGLWTKINISSLEGENPLIFIMKNYLPFPVQMLLCLALISTLISSADTCLINASTIVEHDILGRKKVKELRVIVVIIGIISIIMAMKNTDIISLLTGAYSIYSPGIVCPLFVAIICYRKRTIRKSIWYMAVLIGGFMGLINTYFGIGGKYMPLLAMGISGFLSVLSVSKEDSWN